MSVDINRLFDAAYNAVVSSLEKGRSKKIAQAVEENSLAIKATIRRKVRGKEYSNFGELIDAIKSAVLAEISEGDGRGRGGDQRGALFRRSRGGRSGGGDHG